MSFSSLIQKTKSGDRRALAELLTAIEKLGPKSLKNKFLLEPESPAFRIGITGPPGAGKSSLVNSLIDSFRKKNLNVAVLAVDPSSPFTGGAILGDRIRYMKHTLDEKVFVRSIGTRGSLGGLSAAAYLMLRAFDVAKFDVVLIETVGVGQTELEIINVADTVAVVLVPESGDSIQAMKAGLIEIADVFVVNKSDRPGADSFKHELESILHLDGERARPVLMTVATEERGIEKLAEFLLSQNTGDKIKARYSPKRLRLEAMALLRSTHEEKLLKRSQSVTTLRKLAGLF